LKGVNEDVKGKSKFSDFFQIKKKSQTHKSWGNGIMNDVYIVD
jgi:hypothetical protein